jgi:prevent-host-death family protein
MEVTLLMRSVGLKTLKNKLSGYVRLAAGGETVWITHRGRVVAKIGPPHPARSSMLSDAKLLDASQTAILVICDLCAMTINSTPNSGEIDDQGPNSR